MYSLEVHRAHCQIKGGPAIIYVRLIQVFLNHTFSQERAYTLFVGWVPWEADSEIEMYVQETQWGMFSGTTLDGSEGEWK